MPTEITRVILSVSKRSDFFGLHSVQASFISQTLERFLDGKFQFVDQSARHDIDGVGRVYHRQSEAAEATKTAFRLSFGESYDEKASKEAIRKVLVAEVFDHEKETLAPEEKAQILKFFIVWHEELEKLLVPA